MAAPAVQRKTAFPYLKALDGLRGLLVFPVAFYHFSLTDGTNRILARGSFFAPSVFFALSGFLITSLLLIENERTGTLDWRGFWRRRFRRLIPASVSIVVACAVLELVWPSIWSGLMPLSDTLASLFSLKNWQSIAVANQHGYRLLGPLSTYWSLAVEEQFYLGLSILVAIAVRTRRTVEWLVGLLVAVGVFSIVSLILREGILVREFFGSDTRASEIVAGCLLAVAFHVFGWPSSRWWVVAGWAAMAVLVAAWVLVPDDAPWVLGGGLAAISLVNVPLIIGTVVPGSLATMLKFQPLVELGKISYPVYLVHWPIGLLLSVDRVHFGGWHMTGMPLILLRFGVSVAVGYLIYRYIERPVRHSHALAGRSALYTWAGVAALAIVASVITQIRLW